MCLAGFDNASMGFEFVDKIDTKLTHAHNLALQKLVEILRNRFESSVLCFCLDP